MTHNRPIRPGRFERETLRPQMSSKPEPSAKAPGIRAANGRGCTARIGASVRSGRLSMQRTVVKLTYHPVSGVGGLIRYAAHEGPDRDGNEQEPVAGFTEGSDVADGHAITAEWRRSSDPRYFHMIVSPENGDRIEDTKPMIRAGMEQIQKDWGTRVEWVAYQHDRDEDGQGRHVHVVFRGVDRNDDELLIAPDYIREGLIYRWSEQATKEFGPRSEREIRDGLERSAQLREHKAEKDRLVKEAVEVGAIDRRQARSIDRQYAKSSEAGKERIVQQVRETIDRQRTHEPEMTP